MDSSDPKPPTLDIYYKKTRNHRTIYVDGVWVGISPHLELQLAFFKDLIPIPDYVTHSLPGGDMLGPEVARVAQKGMVRETEVTIVMSAATVEQVINIMQQFVEQIRQVQAAKTEGGSQQEDSGPPSGE